MGKVFVFLADGFEEIEGLTVVDMLRRAEIPTVTVSIGSSRNIIGAHRIEVEADIMFHEVLEAEGAMYVLPGGMPGTLHLKDHEGLENYFRRRIRTRSILQPSVQHQQYLKIRISRRKKGNFISSDGRRIKIRRLPDR